MACVLSVGGLSTVSSMLEGSSGCPGILLSDLWSCDEGVWARLSESISVAYALRTDLDEVAATLRPTDVSEIIEACSQANVPCRKTICRIIIFG